jgi:DNA recombination protein RmuC
MTTFYLLAILGTALVSVALLVLLLRRKTPVDLQPLQPHFDALAAGQLRLEEALRAESSRQREESARAAMALREELSNRIASGHETLLSRHSEAQRIQEEKLHAFRTALDAGLRQFSESSDTRLTRLRQELNDASVQARSEMRQGFTDFQGAVRDSLNTAANGQGTQLGDFAQRLEKLNDNIRLQLESIRQTVETRLNELHAKNEQKLEEMRRTVDEKLEGTLERRLGESFKLVSERLEQVHKGLGEMQVMASSVGDLKRVLTNVKTRGTWGEIQLGALLEQILTADQYAANVAPKPGSAERVEYAIKLPGRGEGEQPVWLAIDAKFPHEDYQRLVDASERADADGVAEAGKALEMRIRGQAKSISEKYISPPHTTDFALLFLPSEGLYAEILRRPGVADALQRDFRVVIAGPTTLAALLNSLQMGFRTLVIQQRSSEVWNVLAKVKSEFGKFGEVLANVKSKLDQASKQIEQTEVRSRAINRTLRDVEVLKAPAPAESSKIIAGPGEDSDLEDESARLLDSFRTLGLDK